jgi:hypothetical protein
VTNVNTISVILTDQLLGIELILSNISSDLLKYFKFNSLNKTITKHYENTKKKQPLKY